MRTLVTATNDRKMFISGHTPSVRRPVSSSKAAQQRRSGVPEKKVNKHATVETRTSLAYIGNAADQNAKPEPKAHPSARQQLASQRDWAVMSQFEKQVFNREKQEQAAERRRIMEAQRVEMHAQQQIAETKRVAKKLEQEKIARAVAADVARHKLEEEEKLLNKKLAAEKTKQARDLMFAESQQKKENEFAAKRLEEFKLVAEAERQLELEKEAKSLKLAQAKEQFKSTMLSNEKLNRDKAQKKSMEAAEDARVAEEYQLKLELEEKKRQDALSALHENIAERAGKAGETVVANAEAAAKAEVERSRKFEDEREFAMAEKERLERESRNASNERTRVALEMQLKMKADENARLRAEDARYAGEVVARVEAALLAEAEAKQQRRRAAVETRLHQEMQMEQKRVAKVTGHFDVMDERERLFNQAILDQAEAVVLRGEAFD